MTADRPAATGALSRVTWPSVSVVVPLRDSAATLGQCLDAVLAQDYPGRLDVVLAVGPSADATEEIARRAADRDARVRVVPNPAAITSAALNTAISASDGDIVVRVDGHSVIPAGYVRRAVETLSATGADNVGGVQAAVGDSAFGRAVAAAMTSRFGVGNAAFHYGGDPGPTDTVYLGVFRRSALDRAGGFDETLIRNEDYELNWRIRQNGGVVWFDPQLRVRYRPRSTLTALARQYFDNGVWKREMLRRHPRSVRLRQLLPPAAVVANTAAVGLAVAHRPRWLAVPGVYAVAAVGASLLAGRRSGADVTVRLPAVFAVMHHAFGAGFLLSRLATRRRGAPPA